MGFKIVLLGVKSTLLRHFMQRIDGEPWIPVHGGEGFSVDSTQSVLEYFEQQHPCLVVSVEPDVESERALFLTQLAIISAVCTQLDVPVIQLSSYKSIDAQSALGEGVEEAVTAPDVCAESVVSDVRRHIILRCSWILDGIESALLHQFLPRMLVGDKVVVSDHDYGSPLSLDAIASALVAIIKQVLTGADNWGVFHLHSSDSCSEAEFCDYLVRQLRKEKGDDIALPTVAPKGDTRRFLQGNANLLGRRITDDFGIQQVTWRRGFARILKEWLDANKSE